MSDPGKKTFWQRLWKFIRRVRFVVWAVIFLVLFALAWVSKEVPGFIQRPLLEKLRARGVAAEFKNLRLSFSRGLVAYQVHFAGAGDASAPQFTARRVELPLKLTSWRTADLSGLRVYDGELSVELPATTNRPARAVKLERLTAVVRFKNDDEWFLENFTARFGQLNLHASGALTNAAALRRPRTNTSTNAPGEARARTLAKLRQVAEQLDRIQFTQPADVRLTVSADARDWTRTDIMANASLAAALTPWGELTNTRVTLHSVPARTPADPDMILGEVETGIAGGHVDVTVRFNVTDRTLSFSGTSDADPQKLRPLLRPQSANWMAQLTWVKPPKLKMAGSVALAAPQDSLQLDGEFSLGQGSFRGVTVQGARSHVTLKDRVWSLPDLRVKQGDHELLVELQSDGRTQDYHGRLVGGFDFTVLGPLLDEKGRHALDLLQFTNAPQFDLEVWGRWRDYDRLGAAGSITISNFAYRDEPVVSLTTRLLYTNLFVHLYSPVVVRTNGTAGAEGVGVDITERIVHLTNAAGAVDLQALGHAIGKQTEKVLQPYGFDPPPYGEANGWFSVDNSHRADIYFHARGTNFTWWNLRAKEIVGDLHWRDQTLFVTNLASEFYTGRLAGGMYFDFGVPEGNFYQFDLQADDARLGTLLVDMTGKTNQVDGVISGRLNITNANTDDFMTWGGDGQFRLRDGKLWELPVFGVFAPVLDALYPNLGNGRASEGSATFTITNGVIRTEDAQLRSVMLRMKYRGTVDLEGRLDARAEAELLRETWGVGALLSTVLTPLSKALEYKVTGTVGKPIAEPLYLPKALLIPLHPIQSVKDIFSDKTPATNDPPKFADPPAPAP